MKVAVLLPVLVKHWWENSLHTNGSSYSDLLLFMALS